MASITPGKKHPLVQPVGVARAEIVNNPHLMRIVSQSIGQGHPKESGPTGD
jgi:hypothetical protein